MTGAVTVLLVCAAGGVGAAVRLIVDGTIRRWAGSSYPGATTVINLTGSFLLGLLTGLAAHQLLPHQWQLIAGPGLLGGYTTFRTASFEPVRLIEDRRYLAAALNGIGMLVTGTAAAALGLLAAEALS